MNWLTCTRCGLHKFRRQVVLGRGTLPADILFVGEGPGKSEDLIGEPFVGPSGRLLDKALEKAKSIAKLDSLPTFYISNVVACRPCDANHGPNRQPTGEEAWACWQRLEETYQEVKPKRVVLLGKIAEKYCKDAWPEATVLHHPAYLLRLGGESSTQFRAFCRNLSKVFGSLKWKGDV